MSGYYEVLSATRDGELRYVSPSLGDDVKASGWLYHCYRCDWRSPVMKWKYGAAHHGNQHVCESRTS